MARLRSQHEITLLQAVTDVRKLQITETEEAIVALQRQRETVAARQEFYLGREKVSGKEKAAAALNMIAGAHDVAAGALKAIAGVMALVPQGDVGVIAVIPHLKALWGGETFKAALSLADRRDDLALLEPLGARAVEHVEHGEAELGLAESAATGRGLRGHRSGAGSRARGGWVNRGKCSDRAPRRVCRGVWCGACVASFDNRCGRRRLPRCDATSRTS